ncbi:hypothetical protein GCM10023350_35640 [Nocardioides endophyticus]|uniref:ABC transporter domain-containing protein n=1 Tax=Nocardioides endophyticus TaxID=1353775 RepID=A0ABP8Z646_9ACTN
MTSQDFQSPVVVAAGLSKHYRRVRAVDDLSFTVRRGAVTGFFGPNGAGKTTALKLLVGLARPSGGSVLLDGAPLRATISDPSRVGVAIEPCGAHPGRTARAHLRALAVMGGLPSSRVEEVLELVGLEEAAGRRVGGYSMGMRQRLGLATALLGDPDLLVLDEPTNGLDPRGIRWLRTLIRSRAAAGRTVLLSSHVLSEAALTVDDVVVIDHGRVLHQGSMTALTDRGRTLEELFFDLTDGAAA